MWKIKYFSLLFVAFLPFSLNAGNIDRDLPAISYVQFHSFNPLNPSQPLTISGQLRIPLASQPKVPAVVVLHGSGGVDSRGALYIEALNDAGIATLEVDMFAARGGARPPLPTLTVPDAFGARNYLAGLPNIDAQRIGVLGFSWGGVVTMLAATQPYVTLYGNGNVFAAHAANYPVCWAYNIGIPGMNFGALAGSPVLVQVGNLDDYDEGSRPCKNLVASLPSQEQAIVSLNIYPNAHHAWDRLQPAITVSDPFSHLGQGGDVDIVPNPGKAFQSRGNVVTFFKRALGLEQ